jgi:ubiquinone/menaquinone biosynthesis C-methylase UbiE
MRAFAISISLVLGLGSTACGGLSKVDTLRVLTSGRDGWQHPERVIEALEIRPGDAVAEIGAGSGYWIPWLSDAVGPSGRVYAVEVEDERVEELRAQVQELGLLNVHVVRGEYEDPLLPDAEIDLAITCLTYHHIDDRTVYFRRLRNDLSPRGRIAHLDDRDDMSWALRLLATEGHWSNVEEMNREMSGAGYARAASFDFLLTQSFQVFIPEG